MNNQVTLTEAAALLGISKPGTLKAVKSEKWPIAKIVGNIHLYYAEDVCEYRDHRYRTQLAKALGWSGRGLYRVEDIDIECPVCGSFAVEWPAPPYLSERFLCLEGHEGSTTAKWWVVWGNDNARKFYANPFDHFPTNEDRMNSHENGFSQVGEEVQAETEAEAIEKAQKG